MVVMDSRAAVSASSAASTASGGGGGGVSVAPSVAEVSAAATVKTVAAHSKGGVSRLAAHAFAPLIATSTSAQVVKVWTEQCDAVSGEMCVVGSGWTRG